SRRTIAAGAAGKTAEKKRLWIEKPDAIKPGLLMPGMKMSDGDLEALVRYLENPRLMGGLDTATCYGATHLQKTGVAKPAWTVTLHEWITTVDHKRLGILYVLYALVFLVIAGIEAMIMRVQLMYPHAHFVSPQVFNRMFTMHGTTMIFFVAMPVLFGFANY